MKHLAQFELAFTFPVKQPSESRQRVSWRLGSLARRYHLPLTQAAFYAHEMNLPIAEGWQ